MMVLGLCARSRTIGSLKDMIYWLLINEISALETSILDTFSNRNCAWEAYYVYADKAYIKRLTYIDT